MLDIEFNAHDYIPEALSQQAQARKKAWAFVRDNAFPKKSEVWKYTDLSKFIPSSQKLLSINTEPKLDAEKLLALKDDHYICLIFIDGRLHEAFSDIDALFDEGAYVKSILGQSQCVKYHKDDIMLALNDAAHTDGLHIAFGDNIVINKPIQLLYVSSSTTNDLMHNYKYHFELGSHAQVSITEKFVSFSETKNLKPIYNLQVFCNLNANAKLNYDIPLADHSNCFSTIHSLFVDQGHSSQFYYTNLALKTEFNRFNVNIELNEPYAEAKVNGATIAAKNAHIDHHIYIKHNASYTLSDVKYRMVANDSASATFNAKALASKSVVGIKAFQNNKNILLSNAAEINTKPELEIYADDVVCSHGATVGQLDQMAIYYIMTRGISEAEAKKLLTESFVVDALPDKNPNKSRYHSEITKALNLTL